MKKTIAIVLGIALISPTPAQADEFLDKSKLLQEVNYNYTLSINAASNYHSKNILNIQNNYNSNLENIKNTAGVKETQSIADYQNAILKWKEVDQVKIVKNLDIKKDTGCKPSSVDVHGVTSKDCVVDINILQSRSSNGVNSIIRLSTQDGGSRNIGPSHNVLGPKVFGEAQSQGACCYGNWGIPGGDNVIYQLVAGWAEWDKPNWIDFNWDFEWQHAQAGLKWEVPAKTILSFDVGWIYPVKLDGTRIPYSEFSAVRNQIKTSYANMLSAQADHRRLIASANDEYSAQLSNAEAYKKSLIADAEKIKFEAESSIDWVKNANQALKDYFPSKIKSDLMKDGYFKPLEPFYYTSKTGKYIVTAKQINQNTVVATAGPEYKRYKYVYTKKEQANHMSISINLLTERAKPYYQAMEQAKSKGYVLDCKAKSPCQIKYTNDIIK